MAKNSSSSNSKSEKPSKGASKTNGGESKTQAKQILSKEGQPQSPLILRMLRLMDAFAKSDDERDFFLDRVEGFLIFADLEKDEEELKKLFSELHNHPERYALLPKLTFYEIKKIMEGFVNEKVYDIDTKEKLLDVIQSKDAREHFLEFIYDHETELEKWQQFYQERSRIRIIEWLRQNNFQFVFEEDLEMPSSLIDKLKMHLFDPKVPKEIATARQILQTKAKSYYSSEALNPRPKRGRPPKQVAKVEMETEVSHDIYTTVPPALRQFLHVPDITNSSSITFSEKYDTEEEFLKHLRGTSKYETEKLEQLAQRFASLQELSTKISTMNAGDMAHQKISFAEDDEDEEDELDEEILTKKKPRKTKT